MGTTLSGGSDWFWGNLVVMCLFLQMSSAFQEQTSLEKRIFCNFEGCLNMKRSDSADTPSRILTRLLASKSRVPSNEPEEHVPENTLSDDKYFGGSWDDGMSSYQPGDSPLSNPSVLSTIVKRLATHAVRKRNTGF